MEADKASEVYQAWCPVQLVSPMFLSWRHLQDAQMQYALDVGIQLLVKYLPFGDIHTCGQGEISGFETECIVASPPTSGGRMVMRCISVSSRGCEQIPHRWPHGCQTFFTYIKAPISSNSIAVEKTSSQRLDFKLST